MIRALLSDGRILIGLDAENIKRLTAGQPIIADLSKTGGRDQIIITYGPTLDDIISELRAAGFSLPSAGTLSETDSGEPLH